MAGINIHASDQASRLFAETALIPSCHPLAPASSSPPKFGTLIPNRIFVGGIPSNTTEQELKSFFSSFGQVKDVKIINDRLGISKGSYGFVTFESQEMAEKIIKNESETLIFKDRKLNIGYAIRKQQIFPRPDLTTALFFTGGAMPYGFQNSMAVFPLPGQEYSMLTQTAAPYATMMLPQPSGGTTLYLPPSLHSTATAPVSAYAHISQHAVTAALQQQFHQTGTPSGLTPAVVGQIAPVNVSTNNTSPQSQSTAAVMAAAAMAAAVQWPQQTPQNNQQSPQQLANVAVAQGIAQANNGHHTVGQTTTITQQQATAMAAAVAAQQQQQQQQATWRWSPNLQQTQNTVHGTSPQSGVCAITTSSSGIGVTASTPTTSNQNIQPNQQVSDSDLSLLQSTIDTLPSTLLLTPNSALTASTAAFLAATAMQQSGGNIFGTEMMNMNFDLTTAAALAALATASIDSSLLSTNTNQTENISNECSKSSPTETDDCYNESSNDLSSSLPAKKARYDIDTVCKLENDK
uniref:RRM domain-containing protein n=1 Tax=Trichobilharzia regenti TaxID=157069 RepID=A0AA85J5A5_TRIRE|nr:unnamed protein product [Trichobilharzia regenti]